MEPKTEKLKVYSLLELNNIWFMPLDSSNLEYAAYDYPNEHLYVKFHSNDKLYRYHEIPLEWWLGFTEADSAGSYFSKSKKLMVDWCYIKLKLKRTKDVSA